MEEQKTELGELDTCYSLSSFLKDVMKVADVNINFFSDHDKTDTQPDQTGETIPLNPGGVGGGATWEPE